MLQWVLFHHQWRTSTQQLWLPLVPCVSLVWTPVTVEIVYALSAMREGVTQNRPPSVLLVSVLWVLSQVGHIWCWLFRCSGVLQWYLNVYLCTRYIGAAKVCTMCSVYNVQCVSMSTGFSLGVVQKGTRGSNVTLVLPTMCPFGSPLYFLTPTWTTLNLKVSGWQAYWQWYTNIW